MKTLTLAFIFALLATSTAARAASHEHEHQHDTATQQATAATHAGTGVLKAVNSKDGKVQIAHEPIAALDWPSMTMWFVLKTPLPQDIKVGDNVRFEIQKNDKKQWVILKIGRK